MNINIRLIKNFTTQYNKMLSEYGEEMARLNGFSDAQLSYTDFIDNFVDKQVVADVSIDGNSNVGHKDIVSLENEMSKPHSKLLAFNKIYYELNKMYDFKTANDWLRNEWDGHLYLHDAYNSTMKPYCYLGEECLAYRNNNNYGYASFKTIYNILEEEEIFIDSLQCYGKYPKNLFVKDEVNNEIVWTRVNRILSHNNNKTMRHIKLSNGLSQIVTEDHPVITERGDVSANSVQIGERIKTFKSHLWEENRNKYIDNIDLGYIVGMVLAEGTFIQSNTYICQKENSPQWNKIIGILENNKIPYTKRKDNRIAILACQFEKDIKEIVLGRTANEKRLEPSYLSMPSPFMEGVIAGLFDGDGNLEGYKNRHGIIRITSRELLNQISYYLQMNGIFVRDRVPYFPQGVNSFKSNFMMFGIGFSIGDNEDYFTKIKSLKIDNNYSLKIYKDNHSKNKQYQDKYDYVEVISNSVFDEEVETVYDITTETGHFICNNILSHNCYAYDLEELVTKGLFFIENFNAQPPQHLNTYTDFVGEFVSWACNRSSGAVGLPSFLIYSYYFWKKDCESGHVMGTKEYYRDQEFQRIIYKLNQPYLRGGIQSAFTNFSIFDHPYMEALFGGKMFPDGTPIMDSIDDIIEYQKCFMEIVSKIRSQNMMTFPVLSYALLKTVPGPDGWVDKPFARWCSNHNMKWGDANFFNSSDVTSLSNCCRLISDVKDLGYFNSIGSTALEVGSVKVNTINLARLSYECATPFEYLKALESKVILCLKTLDVVRHIIKRNVEKGLLPNYSLGLIHLESQYNTIGIIGLYEALQKYGFVVKDEFGNTSYTDRGVDFAKEILQLINSIKDEFSADKDYSVNIEQIPGERAAAVLMQKDHFFYQDEIYELPLYGNQWIPLGVNCTLQEKIKLSAILDKACNGGSIAHINLDAPLTDEETAWELLNYIADAGVNYFAFNLKISSCRHNHGFYGEICPYCGEPKTTTYQRIVGFLTAEKTYSKERKSELSLRKWEPINIDSLKELV